MSNKNNASVQEKMIKLDELVAWFDSDDFALEQAVDKYKEAEALAKEIKTDLDALTNDIQVVARSFDKE